MFGLIDSTTDGDIFLSDLGRRIVDPTQQRRASVDAFLQVPLYFAVYNAFKGQALPPPAALERQITSMGVAEKQKSRARQVFEKSAEQAGFFEQGRNRLVKPGFVEAPTKEPPAPASVSEGPAAERKSAGGDGGDPVSYTHLTLPTILRV